MNYYEILGVSDDSTLKEIKEKFHNLSIRYHPDKNPDDLYSEEKYKQISEAYSVLSNYEKRKLYDHQRKPIMNIDDMSFGFNRLFNMNRLIDDRFSGMKHFWSAAVVERPKTKKKLVIKRKTKDTFHCLKDKTGLMQLFG